jgi:hypothetical protein
MGRILSCDLARAQLKSAISWSTASYPYSVHPLPADRQFDECRSSAAHRLRQYPIFRTEHGASYHQTCVKIIPLQNSGGSKCPSGNDDEAGSLNQQGSWNAAFRAASNSIVNVFDSDSAVIPTDRCIARTRAEDIRTHSKMMRTTRLLSSICRFSFRLWL